MDFSFEALGTKWFITAEQSFDGSLIQKTADDFEQQFSRFIHGNYLDQLNSKSGEIAVSATTAQLFHLGQLLELASQRAFSLQVGQTLAAYGYASGKTIKTVPSEEVKINGTWSINDNLLKKTADTRFDLGAIGKGFCLDLIADQLRQADCRHFLVEAGGDFVVTSKVDGQPWVIGLRHPRDEQRLVGKVMLRDAALACSGIAQRKYKSFHHLIDTATHQPQQHTLGSFVIAPTASIADGIATLLCVVPPEERHQVITQYITLYQQESSSNQYIAVKDVTNLAWAVVPKLGQVEMNDHFSTYI